MPLVRLIRRVEQVPNSNIQVVPVSILWGKNPGREDVSLMKLLFNDDENAGLLQKFFIVLANGRNNVVHMGKPVLLRALIDEGLPTDQTAKKLRRVLRVHFRRQRTTILGQKLYQKEAIIQRITSSGYVQEAINQEAQKKQGSKGRSRRKSETIARKYVKEIMADQSYSAIRMLEILLRKFWTKMFKGVKISGFDSVLEYASKDYEVIYVPNHRSHLDYLLINYSVYQGGLPTPHTAAGINLNFWPVGGLLRRGGAFFLRRSFGGNRLYGAVFSEYLSYLIRSGYPVAFFPEGGRSRSGRLLPLKTGMLSMVVEAVLRNPEKPVIIVPVYVGYDRVVEVGTYIKELSGKSKRKESISSFFSLPKVLKQNWGHAYINFGTPLDLTKTLEENGPHLGEGLAVEKPLGLQSYVSSLAHNLACAINSVAVVTKSGLTSLALLSIPQKAMPEEELLGLIECLRYLGEKSHQSPGLVWPNGGIGEYLQEAEDLGVVRRFSHPGGDVVYMNERDGVLNGYYRNNIIHLYVLPSLVASFIHSSGSVSRVYLKEGVIELFPFLVNEFFLPWNSHQFEDLFETVLNSMVEMELVVEEDGYLSKPELSSLNSAYLAQIAGILGLIFERYTIVAALLCKHLPEGVVNSEAFRQSCLKMSQRITILSGIPHPDITDKGLFQSQIQVLKRLEYLKVLEGDKRYQVDRRVEVLFEKTKVLISQETLGALERLSK